ncbi:hypothetical protein [Actinomadura sediminis]|uniref:Peptidase inhibitor family I36 protein n=1 Tax=Actinomadura sediminis TaxID=1038904 RepID=A0ABW3EZN0_9ACTN
MTVAVAAGFTAFAAAAPAQATGWNVTAGSQAQCKGGTYCLYYAPNVWFGSNNAVWGFNYRAPNLGQWRFAHCSQGGDGSCAGWNTYIRNNAASMSAVDCKGVTVWVYPNYTGNFNWVSGGSWGNLNGYLRNNEASTSRGNLC